MSAQFLIVGAGFSGAVLARSLVDSMDCQVEIWDERNHVAGNCHTDRDDETGVMLHMYGPHIFNTNNERVWAYVNRFGEFRSFLCRIKAVTARGVFSLPINLLTLNQFFGKSLNPSEAAIFLNSLGDHTIQEPANFEEQALKMIGKELYETFFKGYTIKQWGCDPRELPAAVLKRLPVRTSYEDSYYDKLYQGIPAEGYTEVIRSILDHPCIRVVLNKRFAISPERLASQVEGQRYDHLFFTGPIDAFFGHSIGRLGYRTVTFERIDTDAEDYQGNALLNYPDLSVPWTRSHEHKHFAPWEKHRRTVAFREYSKETEPSDVPYYPKCLVHDKELLKRYRDMALELARDLRGGQLASANPSQTERNWNDGRMAGGVSFLGRLGTYRYMDMETVIGEALEFGDLFAGAYQKGLNPPVFPNEEDCSPV